MPFALTSICETNDPGTCVHRSHMASSEITEERTRSARLTTFPARPRRSARKAPRVWSHRIRTATVSRNNGVFDRFESVSGVGDDDQTTGW